MYSPMHYAGPLHLPGSGRQTTEAGGVGHALIRRERGLVLCYLAANYNCVQVTTGQQTFTLFLILSLIHFFYNANEGEKYFYQHVLTQARASTFLD